MGLALASVVRCTYCPRLLTRANSLQRCPPVTPLLSGSCGRHGIISWPAFDDDDEMIPLLIIHGDLYWQWPFRIKAVIWAWSPGKFWPVFCCPAVSLPGGREEHPAGRERARQGRPGWLLRPHSATAATWAVQGQGHPRAGRGHQAQGGLGGGQEKIVVCCSRSLYSVWCACFFCMACAARLYGWGPQGIFCATLAASDALTPGDATAHCRTLVLLTSACRTLLHRTAVLRHSHATIYLPILCWQFLCISYDIWIYVLMCGTAY